MILAFAFLVHFRVIRLTERYARRQLGANAERRIKRLSGEKTMRADSALDGIRGGGGRGEGGKTRGGRAGRPGFFGRDFDTSSDLTRRPFFTKKPAPRRARALLASSRRAAPPRHLWRDTPIAAADV